ncbi:MAG: hypothetical protein FWE07_02815 [Turicibacter sp.]|nr:hypothetical protein [Turicibacter sp.]
MKTLLVVLVLALLALVALATSSVRIPKGMTAEVHEMGIQGLGIADRFLTGDLEAEAAAEQLDALLDNVHRVIADRLEAKKLTALEEDLELAFIVLSDAVWMMTINLGDAATVEAARASLAVLLEMG